MEFHADGVPFSLKERKAVRNWLKECILKGKKIPGDLVFIFTSDSRLKKINRKFLGHHYFTDIITFPYHEPGDKVISGDIYISIDTVRKNASSYGVSVTDELHRVMVHGILHLCGHGDKTPAERKKMRMLEDKFLARRDFIS